MRTDPAAEHPPRYWVFISYSHKDEKWAARLHRQLETYSGHKKLAGSKNASGEEIPARLFPVFRDRDELAGAPDLNEHIRQALLESRYLIVVCSPHAARSRWVNEEIVAFKRLGRESRVFAFIVDGEPHASGGPAGTERECFPEALRFRIGDDGQLTAEQTEPVAGDAREGKDGPYSATLKLIAGILGVRYDDLRRRDDARRRRRLQTITGASLAAVAVFAAIAWYATTQRTVAEERARIALSRQLAAQAANDIPLVGVAGNQANLPRALLLAAQAFRVSPTRQAESTLLKALLASPYRTRYLWGHAGAVNGMAFSATAKLFVSVSESDGVIVWDVATWKPIAPPFVTPNNPPTSVAISPDGTVIAAGGVDGTITLWDVARRAPRGKPLIGHQDPPRALAFSPDGKRLASGSTANNIEGALFLWDVEAARPISNSISEREQRPSAFQYAGAVVDVAFSPDGKVLASASANGSLLLWDGLTMKPVQSIEGHFFSDIAFAPDGKFIASVGRTGVGTRLIARVPRNLLLVPLADDVPELNAGLPDQPRAVSIEFLDADGESFATGHADGTVRFWHSRDGGAVREPLVGHKGAVTNLALNPDRTLLASAANDGTVIVRELSSIQPLHIPLESGREEVWVDALAFSPDGTMLASESNDQVILWDVAGRQIRKKLTVPDGRPRTLLLSPNNRILAALTSENGVPVWDVTRGEVLHTALPGSVRLLSDGAFSPDSNSLALILDNGNVALWNVDTGTVRTPTIGGPKGGANDVAFSPDGTRLAIAGGEYAVVWNLASGTKVEIRPGDTEEPLERAVFSPDGSTLALSARVGAITLWDGGRQNQRELVQSPKGRDTARVSDVVFSPDGSKLVSFGDDTLLLWDVTRAEPAAVRLEGHEEPILRVAFNADGSAFLSMDDAGTVILWDATSGILIARFVIPHPQGSRTGSIAKNLTALATSPEWGARLLLTDLNPSSWISLACDTANQNLSQNEWLSLAGADVPYEPVCPKLPVSNR